MAEQYKTVADIQAAATALIEAGNTDAAVELITNYAYDNAIDWHNYWLEFGDELYGTYMFNRIDMKGAEYPQWWKDIMDAAPRRPSRKNPPSNLTFSMQTGLSKRSQEALGPFRINGYF